MNVPHTLRNITDKCMLVLVLLTGTIVFILVQVFTYKQSTITRQKVTTMHPTSTNGVEDMASLGDLHEGSIMYNLYKRYQEDSIYVSFYFVYFLSNTTHCLIYIYISLCIWTMELYLF